tara:strand:+ start:108 stop:311 length:204 start_codon:yes stop_codon:yes gene_type:complete
MLENTLATDDKSRALFGSIAIGGNDRLQVRYTCAKTGEGCVGDVKSRDDRFRITLRPRRSQRRSAIL